MGKIEHLLNDISISRNHYVETVCNCSQQQGEWKPSAAAWNLVEITEHLFWAEHGGIFGMWKTLMAIREGTIAREVTSVHQNMAIEEIISRTWQPKEQVPSVAAPRMGGTLQFWVCSLKNLQPLLADFTANLREEDLRVQAHPHPISGAMDFQQRLEFIRFHLDRHRGQAIEILNNL